MKGERTQTQPTEPLVIYVFRYDSLTGVPNTQKTIGFEKGSVLFNIGALHTQIGCKQVTKKILYQMRVMTKNFHEVHFLCY